MSASPPPSSRPKVWDVANLEPFLVSGAALHAAGSSLAGVQLWLLGFHSLSVLLAGCVLLELGVLLWPRLRFQQRLRGFTATFYLFFLLSFAGAGVSHATTQLSLLLVVLVAVLGDRRLLTAHLAVLLAVHAVAGFYFVRTGASTSPAQIFDVHQPLNWIRIFIVMGGVSALIGGTIYAIVRELQDRLAHSQQLVADLQQESARRTQAEAALLQAQKQEVLALLASGLAHDLNNTLSIIMLQGDWLESRVQPAGKPALEDIQCAAQRSAELLQQLMAFGRRQEDKRERMDLAALLEECVHALSRIMPRHTLTLEARPPLMVHADATLLQQVLFNLALNARAAMPDGGTIAMQAEQDGAEIRLTVSDTGPGIPADVIEHIFEPFFTTKPTGEGTGLGLAAVERIISEHDGHIRVESVPGQGTTFTLRLPALG